MPKRVVLALLSLLLLLGAGTWVIVGESRRGGVAEVEEPALRPEAQAPRGEEAASLVGHAVPEALPAPLRALQIRGQVVDRDGHAIPGARIYTSRPGERMLAAATAIMPAALADERGRFRLDRLDVEAVAARAEGFLDGHVLRARPHVPHRIVLEKRTAWLTGRVYEAKGLPLGGASLHAFLLHPRGVQVGGRTGADGRFRLPMLAHGAAYLAVWAPGHRQIRRARIPPVDERGERHLEVQLEASFRVLGRVVDAVSGEGIANAEIHSHERFGTPPRSGSDGTFAYDAAADIHWVEASARGYVTGRGTLTVGEDGARVVELRLQPSPVLSLRGSVIDALGRSVAGARVANSLSFVISDTEGSFAVDVVAEAAPWPLIVYHPAHGLILDECELEGDGRPGEVVLAFPATRAATGSVRFSDGRPAPQVGIRVAAEVLDVDPWRFDRALVRLGFLGTLAETDAAGAFALPPLPEGSYTVTALPPRGVNALPAGVSFESGSTAGKLEIVLEAGGVVEGVVLGRGGKALAGTWVEAHPVEKSPGGHRRVVGSRSGEDGRFRLVGLPVGPLRFSATAEGYDPWRRVMTPDADPLAIRLEPRPQLRMHITENPPPAGAEVMVVFQDAAGKSLGGGSASFVGGEVRTALPRVDACAATVTWRHLTGGPVAFAASAKDVRLDMPLRSTPPAPAPADGNGDGAGALAPVEPAPLPLHGWVRARVAPLPEGGLGRAWVAAEGTPVTAVLRPDGAALLHLRVGKHLLHVHTPEADGPPLEVEVSADRTHEVTLRLPDVGVSLSGQVVDGQGTPIPSVVVTAQPAPAPWRSTHAGHEATTDRDGRFRFHFLTKERYVLRSKDDRSARGEVARTEAVAGRTDVVLRYRRHGLLKGTVTGDWERLPDPFTLQLLGERVNGAPAHAVAVRVQPDGDRFYFEVRLPPGRYQVKPPQGRSWARRPEDVVVEEGVELDPVRLELEGFR